MCIRDRLRPEPESQKAVWAQVHALMREGKVLAAYTPGMGGVAEALFKMCIGNGLGFRLAPGVDVDSLFDYAYGSFVLELAGDADCLLYTSPFGDNIERARRSGVTAIVEPGGSIRDEQVIETCDKYGIVMAFNGLRLFHH